MNNHSIFLFSEKAADHQHKVLKNPMLFKILIYGYKIAGRDRYSFPELEFVQQDYTRAINSPYVSWELRKKIHGLPGKKPLKEQLNLWIDCKIKLALRDAQKWYKPEPSVLSYLADWIAAFEIEQTILHDLIANLEDVEQAQKQSNLFS